MSAESWELDRHDGLLYAFTLPPGYDPASRRYPVVVYLHGSAERGDDGRAHLKNGVQTLAGQQLIAVAPQCPREDTFGGSWYGGDSPAQRRVVALVEALKQRRSVDASRVALIGFSMGAIGGWELLAKHRGLFRAACLIAGDLEPRSARGLEGFPLWAFHGSDDALVSNAAVRAVAAMLPPPFRYTEVPNAGHDSWRAAFSEPALLPFLLGQ